MRGLDAWITTTPQDEGHEYECNCWTCHKFHIEHNQVIENSESPDFDCCRIHVENLKFFNGSKPI